MENELIKLTDEEGNIKDYRIILTFKWSKTNKNYIVYTDNLDDKSNTYNIYAKIYDPSNLSKTLENINSKEEWNLIETKVNRLGDYHE